jgi:phosphofructokinase-like protein
VEKILISTGGGDAPGLNAAIYSAVHTAERLGFETYGVRDGYDGLLYPENYEEGGVLRLTRSTVRGIAKLGGTILGTTNRGNPFRQILKQPHGGTTTINRSEDLVAAVHALGISAVIAIGGDGSLTIAHGLSQLGLRVVGVPKTIDNDLSSTDLTFGFQTAVSFATECIERLHATAEAHRRILCVEVMGRNAGWIALHAGVAAMADVILIPEIPFTFGHIAAHLRHRVEQHRYAIVVIAEGARPMAGEKVVKGITEGGLQRLGGIGLDVADRLQETLKVEARAVTLGHLLRGGEPIALDRLLGLAFGSAAVQAVVEGKNDVMVALNGTRIVHVPLKAAIDHMKSVPLDGLGVGVARALDISLGDAALDAMRTDSEIRTGTYG